MVGDGREGMIDSGETINMGDVNINQSSSSGDSKKDREMTDLTVRQFRTALRDEMAAMDQQWPGGMLAAADDVRTAAGYVVRWPANQRIAK